MDRGSAAQNSRLVEEVFRDIKGRRAAIIRALTTDFEDFYQQCDPAKENLCLYGYPDEQWEVNLPAEEVPPEIPEPVLGINFARDGMEKKSWLSLVALHSDAWLLALSSYFSGRFQFEKKHRKLLLDMITDMPTICEVVNGKNQDKTSGSKLNNNKSKSNSKLKAEYQAKNTRAKNAKEENEELDEEEDDYLCAACGESSVLDNFWIFCDTCEKWFHGKCVKVTPAKAEHIKNYKCPRCSNNKRIRTS
ncbi:PHD finger protein ALFIN-LIKE 3-like [Zingiber officinale]|uniref:PHD finger protein ALFIN-LIKE 3-like n=1 Tax=Zingiber officinale TaxID=94328 RepID=UPI001C4B7115|nr:PHD finger protein ALFIN-LIKE 3-like [Zingiber officinale]